MGRDEKERANGAYDIGSQSERTTHRARSPYTIFNSLGIMVELGNDIESGKSSKGFSRSTQPPADLSAPLFDYKKVPHGYRMIVNQTLL